MAAGEVVGGILLAGDQLLRMEQLTVRTRADLIDHRRLQVDEDAARNVLASARLGEEGVERVITATDRLVARHLTVRLNTVLQAEELPATVTDLATGLRCRLHSTRWRMESRQHVFFSMEKTSRKRRLRDEVACSQMSYYVIECLFFVSFPSIITCR